MQLFNVQSCLKESSDSFGNFLECGTVLKQILTSQNFLTPQKFGDFR